MMRFLANLRSLDRRWLYLALVSLTSIPLFLLIPMPRGAISPTTRGLYDLVESCPDDKVIWIDSSWDAGSAAENRAQLDCVVRHICSKKAKFVVTSAGVTIFAPQFADEVIRPIAEKAGYVYGRDWVNLGYKVPPGGVINLLIQSICLDFHQLYPADFKNRPISELPLMESVRTIKDVHLVYCVTYSPANDWISFVNGQFGTPVAFGCMTISGPGYYPFIDSGQLGGMLVGNRGAAEYEALLESPGLGTQLIMAMSFGGCAVLLASLIGNVGVWASTRLNKQEREG